MTDRYENIRRALEMGPTHGPWHATKPEPHGTEVRGPVQVSLAWCGGATTVGEEGCYSIGAAEAAANAHFIAACDPNTIRALLAERDALRELEERKQRDEALLRQALEALEQIARDLPWELTGLQADSIAALRERLAETADDLTRCPNCGGPADNGHDREVPPNPYWCSKCTES